MTDAPDNPRDWRRIALYLVALGGMSVSISGQVATIEAQLGGFLAVVFALTNDVGAILALDISLTAASRSIRFWAWIVMLLAAGTGGALNVHHMERGTAPLPDPLPKIVGIEPVLLVLVLSHLIGLVLTARKPAAADSDRQPSASQPIASPSPASQPVVARVGDRQETAITTRRPTPGDRQPAPAPGDRQLTERQPAAIERATPAATRQPDRTPTPDAPRPARVLSAVPTPRPPRRPWMTDELLAAVVEARRADPAYGRQQVVDDHQLGTGKARSLLEYIDRHDLLRVPA